MGFLVYVGIFVVYVGIFVVYVTVVFGRLVLCGSCFHPRFFGVIIYFDGFWCSLMFL